MYCYRPPGETWQLLPWDLDATLGVNINDWGATDRPLFQTDDAQIARLTADPFVQRAYWRAVQDLVNGPMLAGQIEPIIDGNDQALSSNGIVAGTNNLPVTQADADALKTYLSGRRAFLLGELAKVAAPAVTFEISNDNGNDFSVTNQSSLLLLGKAPIEVASIQTKRINGTNSFILQMGLTNWTSVTNWAMSMPLANGTNRFEATAFDRLGLSNAFDSITVANQ